MLEGTMGRLVVGCLTLGLLAGCKPDAPKVEKQGIPYPTPDTSDVGKVVAQIGDIAFTTDEFETRLRSTSPFTRAQLADPAQKKRFVDREIRAELLAQEGWRRKMHEDPKMLERFKQMIVTELMNAEIKKLEANIEVTDGDLVAAYKARFDEFNKPAKVRIAQIVRFVKTDKERAAAKKLLQKIEQDVLRAERKNDPRAFSRFAQEHTQDESTKKTGGDLNFLTRKEIEGRYGEGVAKFMFDDVKVGDMGIADAEDAVVLFKKTGRRRGVERSLEQVKPKVRSQLIAEKRGKLFEDWVQKLISDRGVTIDYSLLDEIEVDTGGTPSGIPSKPPTQ